MKIFYKGNDVLATHLDKDTPSLDAYGADVSVMDVPDDFVLEKKGPAPAIGSIDTRPYVLPVLDLKVFKSQVSNQILEYINKQTESILAQYPQSEILSWTLKESAARAFLNKEDLSAAQEAMLDAENSVNPSTTKEDLCKAIVYNADKFILISGTLAGIRTQANIAIANATTEEAVLSAKSDVENKVKDLFKK